MKLTKAVAMAILNSRCANDTDEIELPDNFISGTPNTTPASQPTPQPEPKQILGEGWLREDGTIDTSKIADENLAKELSKLNSQATQKTNDEIVNTAISEQLKGMKLKVKPETIEKLLDRSGISVVNNRAVGVTEAFEALKKSDAGLFASSKTSPVEEGFEPSNGGKTDFSKMSDLELVELAMAQAE